MATLSAKQPHPDTTDPFRLDGLVAVVTGGAGGIGVEVGRQLALRGASVALADLGPTEWAAGALDLLPRRSSTAHAVDITDGPSCERLVEAVVAAHDGIDVLVNCAGINARSPAAGMDMAEWQRILDVNLTGTFRMTQAAHGALSESHAPSVVNLTSTAGAVAVPDNAHYSVSKAGLIHLTRVLAYEWAPAGIRVNSVGPTIVATEMTAEVRSDSRYLADKLASIPLGRMATVGDVSLAVCYLASPAAAMVTGQTLFVDGGVTTR